jgi:hypothetical protein
MERKRKSLFWQAFSFIKMYKYKNKNNEIEDVAPEKWGWGVVYKDDTELKQFDDNGYFHCFEEINKSEVKLFVLYNLEDSKKRIDLVISDGMQLIHFYRNIKTWYNEEFVKVYVFGYKKGEDRNILFVLPDGRIIMSNRDDIDLSKFNI